MSKGKAREERRVKRVKEWGRERGRTKLVGRKGQGRRGRREGGWVKREG